MATTQHQFAGVHYLASFVDCDRKAMLSVRSLRNAIRRGITKAGATILGSSEHLFEGGGWTCTWVLSESHASIHTYPEYGNCFVDLFTCGMKCDYHAFEDELKSYLSSGVINQQVIVRS